ncbi:hypothetical protein D0Z00_000251 [Geotrichum galactomycetum]|uniref:Uncharacterized protein n=1 Tax=Geotrichum galactomycetum TaxID=27317 RepID=A0ACB6VAC2_9ASCO|nr:hypothetical protein D0Z00_000251 [Geotrichum candidum]
MPFPFSLKFGNNQDASYSSLPADIETEMPQTESNQIEVHDISTASSTSLPAKLSNSDQKGPAPQKHLVKSDKSKTAPAKLVDPSRQEILYTNKASLNVGQLYRYKITYTPPEVDPDSPSFGSSLFLKIKNLEVVALRAAFLAGPFILYVDVRPEDYDQDKKAYSTADQPMYEPQLKAGQSFYAELFMNKNKRQYTWIVDVVSQIIFSKTAQVQFELSIGTSKEVLHGLSPSLKVPINPISGIVVTRFDTLDLWHSPMPKFDKPLHLVVITHGLHSNTGADMLYVKEAIDKIAKKTGENIIVRGYFDNVRRTEKGIKYLGTRVAEYIVHDLAPVQPVNLPPVKKISFIGHSLGGLVQTFAIAYIADHYPDFFKRVEPVNFICLASPLLGISNENPGYIKFALDIGFVGKSGQDISLTRKPNGHSKPLLQILPTGPTHKILVQFKRRTVYANAVNDGIVPLRTSALLYLDWQGLGQVKQAKLDEAADHNEDASKGKDNDNDSESSNDTETNETNGLIGKIPREAGDEIGPREMNHHSDPSEEEQKEGMFTALSKNSGGLFSTTVSQPVQSMFSYFAPQAGTHKPPKMYTRGQTKIESDNEGGKSGGPENFKTESKPGKMIVPKKTSVFESGVSVLLPPLPSQSFILDPGARPETIFHDKIYHDYDLPPPKLRKRSSLFRRNTNPAHNSSSSNSSNSTDGHSKESDESDMVDKSKLEEIIARDWHKGMSWRKVLVKLEPDAHNNIIVRRRFANAYGWPVIDHLVKAHFGGEKEKSSNKATSAIKDEKTSTTDQSTMVDGAVKGSKSDTSLVKPTNSNSSSSSGNAGDDRNQQLRIQTSYPTTTVNHLTYNPLEVLRSGARNSRSSIERSRGLSPANDGEVSSPSSPVMRRRRSSMATIGTATPTTERPNDGLVSQESFSSTNSQAWRLHLDTNRDDSEDEGILFTMGNMFDNIREIGNLNFATAFASATGASGDGNESHEGYTYLNNNSAMIDGQHRQLYEEEGDTVGYVSEPNGHRVIQTRSREQDEYDMYGPLNGETIEERLAKQTF